MQDITFLPALLGGMLIGLAAALLWIFGGRLAGVSGIAGGLIAPAQPASERRWRALFVLGLVVGGVLVGQLWPSAFEFALHRSALTLAVAGVLVGVGTRLGGGCTSGHGVCGIGRLSPRSVVATL